MGKLRKNERGLLSLEASIALTIFIFLMLFFYSFFVVFEVRNEIGHTLLATANSMSLDQLENDKLGHSGTVGQILYSIYSADTDEYSDFINSDRWHVNATVTDDAGNTSLSEGFTSAIEERFFAYLTGGNAADADKILGRYHVVGGRDGLDFSGSSLSGGKLFLSVRYKVEYEFKVFNLGELEFEQKVCSKMWS